MYFEDIKQTYNFGIVKFNKSGKVINSSERLIEEHKAASESESDNTFLFKREEKKSSDDSYNVSLLNFLFLKIQLK